MGDKEESSAGQKGSAAIFFNPPPQVPLDRHPAAPQKFDPQPFEQGSPVQRFIPPPSEGLQQPLDRPMPPPTAPPKFGQPPPQPFEQGSFAQRFIPPPPFKTSAVPPQQPLDRPMPPLVAPAMFGQPPSQSFEQGSSAQYFIPPPPGGLQPQDAIPPKPSAASSQPSTGPPQFDSPKLGVFHPPPSSKFFVPLPMETGNSSSEVSPPVPPPGNPSEFRWPQVAPPSSGNFAASPELSAPLQQNPGSSPAQPGSFPVKFGSSVLPPFPGVPKPGTVPPKPVSEPSAKLGAAPTQVPQKQATEGTSTTYAFQVAANKPQPVSSAASPYFAPVPFKPAANPPPRYQSASLMPEPPYKEEAKEVPESQGEQVEETGVVKYLSNLVEKGKEIVKSYALPLPEDEPYQSVKWRLETCTWLTKDWENWTCPRCTYQNTCEYYQCEMCGGENTALRTILHAVNRPAKIHEHTGLRTRLGL